MTTDLPSTLLDVRRAILNMGALVDSRVQQAVEAVANRDFDKAEAIRHGDRAVDEMELDIEKHCIQVLALLQPVARDLRFIMVALRVNGELERIADLAKGIAKRVLHLRKRGYLDVPDALAAMALEVRQMVIHAIQALADEDVALANRVRRADRAVDEAERHLRTWAQATLQQDVTVTEAVIDTISIARSFERIADMCTNMAEDVVYLVQGEVVRHSEAG